MVLGSIVLVLVTCVAIAGSLLYINGRTITAPDWVRDRAITEFSKALPGASVRFDNLTVEVQADWHPRILLERVVIRPINGGPALEFSEAETSLSYRRLLQRQVAPRDIRLSGVFLKARRAETGQMVVSFGEAQDSLSGAEERANAGVAADITLPDLIEQIDSWLSFSQFERLTNVTVDALTVQFDDLRAKRAWTIDGGQLQMRRAEDQLRISANLALLGGRDYVSTLEFNYESAIGETSAGIGIIVDDVASEDIATQSPALAWLDILRAPISGAMRVEIDETGALGPLSAALQVGEGIIQPDRDLTGIPFRAARSYLTYLPGSNTIRFDELFVESSWITARAEGKAHLEQVDSGLPNALIAQIRLTELSGNPADLFETPVSIDRARADLHLQLEPFSLQIGEMLVQDQGHSLVLDADIRALDDDWQIAVNGHMDALDARRVLTWWPEQSVPKTREWIDENIHDGRLTDINLALRSAPRGGLQPYVDFHFEEASVRYAKTLPIVTNGRGQAVFHEDRFAVMAHGGTVSPGQGGGIEIAGTTFVIPDTKMKPPPAVVDLRTDGTITATLALLDHAPLSFLSKANLPVDLAQGRAQTVGKLSLPLKAKLPAGDVVFDVAASLTDVRSDHFVKDKVIAAQILDVRATNDSLTISGPGRIGAVPFDATFVTGLGPDNSGESRVSGTVDLSEQFIDEFNIGLTSDLVSGRGKGAFELAFQKGEPGRFSVTTDTRGLTMGVASLGWFKPADQVASLSVEGTLSSPMTVDLLTLDAPGLKAQGGITLKPEGGLDRVALSDVQVGNWLSGSADLVGRTGRAPDVVLRSGRLDLRNAPSVARGEAAAAGAGIRIDATLDRVTISEGIALTGLKGLFSTSGGFSGQFTSQVNGGAAISGAVVPSNGRSAVRIQSEDAGGTMRSAGILKQAQGGQLDVTLQPNGPDGHFAGRLNASSVRIKDAPAMAELLNAISVVGLLDQLGGTGIAFADINAAFELNPTYVHLTEGSAVGPSMGISMDGIYHLGTGQLDMQGVVSPIYMLNAIGRPVSKRGEGLFGFNYSLRGTSESPSVSVNPLSVLTPGFLREIFRRPTQVPDAEPSQDTSIGAE
ncbi:AsmA-like C-terminal region [Cognatishimia maritima]|uniref:AsmA-like C-terminal region n=2 Tax=Cognatishimia maritima TaxID=870908 RepID=A0A1M5JEY5_9RHOB|nr:AsmA-like C-terminal region [Cognatishimia maritima]